jgi:hypothetical protein
MTTEPTAGEWVACQVVEGDTWIEARNGSDYDYIAAMLIPAKTTDERAEQLANANLMAASKDLLAALESLRELLRDWGSVRVQTNSVAAEIAYAKVTADVDVAIQKARGETND